jgi:hypothetical protein
MTLARIHFVLLALAVGTLPLRAQTPNPLWETELTHLGYQGRPPATVAHLSPVSASSFTWAYQQGVVFTNQDTVAFYFVVYDAPSGNSESHASGTLGSFRFVAIFLNARNGELIKQLDWALPPDVNPANPPSLFAAERGRFIVVLGQTINLYSADFKLLARSVGRDGINPLVSPSGESLLLRSFHGRSVQYDLLDTEKLSVLRSWNEPVGDSLPAVGSFWGDRFTWIARSTLYVKTPTAKAKRVLAGRPGYCDHILKSSDGELHNAPGCDTQDNVLTVPGDLCGGWRLIGKDLLAGVVCTGDDKLLTVSTEGKMAHEFNLSLEQPDGPAIPSQNGKRFAFPTLRWGLATNNTPDQMTARVFDLESVNPLLTLNVPADKDASRGFFYGDFGDTRFGWGGLALSPDGSLLAVKSGGAVRVYSVPEKAPSSPCVSKNCEDSTAASSAQPLQPRLAALPASPLVERMLSWFPADTESVIGVMGPRQMPKVSRDPNGHLSAERSSNGLRDTFQQVFLAMILNSRVEFKDAHVAAAMEGSRGFRGPKGLGMAPYEGAAIAVFSDDITNQAAEFIKSSASTAVRTEQIEGQRVAVFQDKYEEDIWTTFVAFPRPDVIVVASDENFLRETLARIGGAQGKRALPDVLPEWKHVDTHAEFWALRHHSGPLAENAALPDCGVAYSTSEKATGIAFSYSPGMSNLATIDFLSDNEETLHCIQKGIFNINERGVAEMHAQYNEVQPGVLEGSYSLDQIESSTYFVIMLETLLGHSIVI